MDTTKPSTIIKPEDTTKVAPKEAVEEIELPRVEGPIMNFNKTTKMFWIGVPADRVAPFECTLILDSMKIEYLKAFNTVQVEAKNKIQMADPSVLNRIRNNFLRSSKKA